MNRIIIIIYFLFLNYIVHAQDFWEDLGRPASVTLTDVISDSQGNIFLSALISSDQTEGGIYRSFDNGISWQKINSGLTYPNQSMSSLSYDSEGNIYAGGAADIYKSINSGDNWNSIFHATIHAGDFATIRCGFDSIVLAGGIGVYGIVRSGDRGQTWNSVLDISHLNYQESVTDIQFGPDEVIYACTRITLSNEQGRIFASYDLGHTWLVIGFSIYPMSLGFDVQGRLLMGEFGFGLKRYDSYNGQWIPLLGNGCSPQEILTLADNRIYLGCSSWPSSGLGGVMYSPDGGGTFEYLNSGFNVSPLDAKEFAIDEAGRLMVINGYLYRSYDTIFSASQNELFAQNLIKIFPNPFHDLLTIKADPNYYIEKTTLQVYNIQGVLVFSIILSDNLSVLNLENLRPGLYIVKILNGKSSASQKVAHY